MSFLEIEVDDKRFGQRQVLRQLRLTAEAGEILSLLGASGCGKSTLLSIAAGLDRDCTASIRLDGRLLQGPDAGIGFVFQEPRLFPWLTVAENISFGAGVRHPPEAVIEALLKEVGLPGYAAALPKQLSGGQAQRVAIARGLYTRPRVLLLDEPFSAVDALTRMKLQDLLAKVARERGLTVLLVTHDIDEAVHLSDRVVLLDRQPGPARAVLPVPQARPRVRGDAAAAGLRRQILAHFELEPA
jgi:sulfonate transport system ATP-binding protein